MTAMVRSPRSSRILSPTDSTISRLVTPSIMYAGLRPTQYYVGRNPTNLPTALVDLTLGGRHTPGIRPAAHPYAVRSTVVRMERQDDMSIGELIDAAKR